MPDLNPFNAFTVNELSAVIEKMPRMYGEVNRSGLFKPAPLLENIALIDEEEGRLRIAESRAFGSPGQGVGGNSRAMRAVPVPHFPFDTHINPKDVNGLRKTGTNQRESIAAYIMQRLESHKRHHEITIEFMLVGALRGRVVDGSNRTLLDMWQEFGVTQETISIEATNDAAKLKQKFRDIARIQEDALDSDTMSGSELRCSRGLFDAIVDHPVIQKAYINNQFAPGWVAEDLRKKGIIIEGVRVIEYEAKAPGTDGVVRQFIPANEGICYPMGTQNTFKLFNSPSDFNEDVGKYGQQYYAKIQEGDFNRGWDLHSQFNSLPICLRPKTLVKVTK